MRPGFFLKESLRSMRRNVVPSFAALASVLVTTLVLGVFIPVVQATNGAANDVRKRVLEQIQRKVEGKEITEEPAEAPKTQIIDLMEALKASLDREKPEKAKASRKVS